MQCACIGFSVSEKLYLSQTEGVFVELNHQSRGHLKCNIEALCKSFCITQTMQLLFFFNFYICIFNRLIFCITFHSYQLINFCSFLIF